MGFRINHEGTAGSGLAGWLLSWWRSRVRGRARVGPRMALLERIPLAPRQTLCLVEVDGRRFLIATSPEGAPSFYALDARRTASPRARVSW